MKVNDLLSNKIIKVILMNEEFAITLWQLNGKGGGGGVGRRRERGKGREIGRRGRQMVEGYKEKGK